MPQSSRRRVLKGLAYTAPVAWSTPLVNSVILPAHAQMSPPGGEVTTSESFLGGPVPPSGTEGTSTFDVIVSSPASSITDVTLDLDVTHTWIGDLDISLSSPGGTTESLIQDVCDSSSYDDMLLTLDQSAGAIVGSVCPPTTGGSFTPNAGSLNAFLGEDPNGTWTLTIVDDAGVDSGFLNSAALNITAT